MFPAPSSRLLAQGFPNSSDLVSRTRQALTQGSTPPSISRHFPGVRPEDLLLISHLRNIISVALADKHCVAEAVTSRRCGLDITPRDALKALRRLEFLGAGSDAAQLGFELVVIARLGTCKRRATGHAAQAWRVADRWLEEADRLTDEVGRWMVQQALRARKAEEMRRKAVWAPSRIVELEEEEEVEEEVDLD